MQVQIGGKKYAAAEVELRLPLGGCAEVAVAFPAGAGSPLPVRLAAWALAGERGTLHAEGGAAGFEACGFDDGDQVRLRGRVAPAGLTAWLRGHPPAAEPLVVHQWQGPPQAPDAWEFLNTTMSGGKFARPPQDVVTACAAAVPVGGAVVRQGGVGNVAFLQRVLGLLAEGVPNVAGWHAVGDAAQPFRLVLAGGAAVKLEGWEAVPPWRDDGPGWPAGRLRRAVDVKRPGALLEAVAVRGRPCGGGDLERPADLAQILAGPGPLRRGETPLFGVEVAYRFAAGQPGRVTAEVTFAAPPAHVAVPPAALLDSEFDSWLAGQPRVAQVKPVGWAVRGGLLRAALLVPTTVYVRRQKGQPLRLLVLPGQVPAALGAVQQQDGKLDRHGLTLGGDTLWVPGRKASFGGAVRIAKKLDVAPPGGKE